MDELENLQHFERINGQNDNTQDLMKKICSLKSSRENLQHQLQILLQTEAQLDADIDSQLKKGLHEDNTEAVEKHQQLENLLDVYRISGKHVCSEDKNKFTVCLDASYENKILESYYIEFQDKGDKCVISKHSLPMCIPVLDLETRFLTSCDLSSFLDSLLEYLNVFVYKREQIKACQSMLKDADVKHFVEYTSSYDFVKISIENGIQCHKIKLTYDSLNIIQPSKVFHQGVTEDGEEEPRPWKSWLQSRPLFGVIKKMLTDITTGK